MIIGGPLNRLLGRVLPRWRAGIRQLWRQLLDSEWAWYWRVRRGVGSGDPRRAYRTLLAWLDRRASGGETPTLAGFVARSADAELSEEIVRLERALYSADSPTSPWNPERLLRALRRTRQLSRSRDIPTGPLLPPLNPR
jgi:hypothetical protein